MTTLQERLRYGANCPVSGPQDDLADDMRQAADEIDRLTTERDALAAKVDELRDALEALLRWVDDWSETSEHTGFSKVEHQCDKVLDDAAPAEILAARDARVRAQALRDAADKAESEEWFNVIAGLRGMADAIEKGQENG